MVSSGIGTHEKVWSFRPSIHPSISYGVLVAVGSFLQGIIQSPFTGQALPLWLHFHLFTIFWGHTQQIPVSRRLMGCDRLYEILMKFDDFKPRFPQRKEIDRKMAMLVNKP